MERLIFVPIEILEERYSKQWFLWFMKAFKSSGIDPIVVGDQSERSISTGEFLDVYDTNSYKLNQLLEIIQILKNNPDDKFLIFFMDAWFSGIEAISYIRDCAKRRIRIKGMLHAGTWDAYDFLSRSQCDKWAKPFELSLFKQFDEMFIATDFHTNLIKGYFNDTLLSMFTKVDWPVIRFESIPEKENIVVFPHRLAPEKNPHLFDALRSKFTADFGSAIGPVEFIKTKDVCKTKTQYYELLLKSKVAVSFANQETFGIAMAEAYNAGCFPVVPDRLSYKETFSDYQRFCSLEEATTLVYKGLTTEFKINSEKFKPEINWVKKIME